MRREPGGLPTRESWQTARVADLVLPFGAFGVLLVLASSASLIVSLKERRGQRWRFLLALDAVGVLMVFGAIGLAAASLGPGCNTFMC